MRLLRRKPAPPARVMWMRTAMQNCLWAGIGGITLGLIGGLRTITGVEGVPVYTQAPVSGTGALILLAVGPALLLASTMIADRMKASGDARQAAR